MDITWLSLWTVTVPGLVVLGFVMGFSPTLYGVSLHYLVQGRAGQRAVVAMMAGLVVGCTVLMVLYQFVDGAVLSEFISSSVRTLVVQRYVDLVAGIVLMGSAVLLSQFKRGDRLRDWYDETDFERRREERMERRREKSAGKTATARTSTGFWVGVGNSYFGTSGFATMYIVSRVVDHVGDDFGLRALVYLAFIPSLVAPYLFAAWAWQRWPRMASGISRGYRWVVSRNYYRLAVLALAVAGVVFFVMGLHGLIAG